MTSSTESYTAAFDKWIPPALDGQAIVLVHSSAVRDEDEWIWGSRLICQRQLFGHTLRVLLPDLFDRFGSVCGALVAQEIPSHLFGQDLRYPGDVDLLIVPYSDGRLWLSDTVAVEVKIVRASFLKQGRSPNKYGVSQAQGLLDKGFPQVAVLHLITSDTSPPEAWREMARTQVLDSEGRCGPLEPVNVDMLPADLIDRVSGRLAAAVGPELPIGHVATYISSDDGLWIPSGRSAKRNPTASTQTMDSIERLINTFPAAFINVPSRPRVLPAPPGCEPMILDRRQLLRAS